MYLKKIIHLKDKKCFSVEFRTFLIENRNYIS